MDTPKANGFRPLMPLATIAMLAFGSILGGCREEDPMRTSANQGSLPTMVTFDVDTYISDSGYVKYHAVTDIWEMYDDTAQPFWRFPKPLSIDILAPGNRPHSHIRCDSARYLTQRQLFRFDGHVVAVNVAKDSFLTKQLYWDQKSTEFYTDSFIHIRKADRIIEGYGFRSNEKMTRYTIQKPTAIIPVSAFRNNNNEKGAQPNQQFVQNRDSADRATEKAFGDPSQGIPIPASQRNNGMLPSSINPTQSSTAPRLKR